MSVQNVQNSPFMSFNLQMKNSTSNMNFKTAPYAPDTVEISGNKSNTQKVAIGIGAILLTTVGTILGVKAYRASSIKKAQKTFQEVFMRDDITREETAQMLQRYKDIGKIQDKEEYIKALFNEAKANFGFKNGSLDLKLFTSKERPNSGGYVQKFMPFVNINKDQSRQKILNTIHHELRHKKQEFLMLNKGETLEEFYKAMVGYRGVKIEDDILDVINVSVKEIQFKYPDWLKQFGIDKLDKTRVRSEDNEYVEHLLTDLHKYESYNLVNGKVNEGYRDNFLEVDARKTGKAMEKLLSGFLG